MRIFEIFKTKPKLFVAFDSGQGEPIIFLHGIAADSTSWNLVRAKLANSKHRLIGLDLLGFGQSPKPTSSHYTLDDHARSVERTLKSSKIKHPVTIVGHSLGALVAIRIAYRNNLAIKNIILCAPPIYLNQDLALTTKKYSKTSRAKNNAYFSLYGAIARRPNMSLRGARLVANRFSDFSLNESTWIPFKRSLVNSINKQASFKELTKLQVPIKIIYGKLDVFLVPLHYKEAATLNKNILVTTYNGGHSLTEKFSTSVAASVLTPRLRQKP